MRGIFFNLGGYNFFRPSNEIKKTSNSYKINEPSFPENIDDLRQKYNYVRNFNQMDFERDSCIVVLNAAKNAVSTRLGIKHSADDKKRKIDEFIDKLKQIDVSGLENIESFELFKKDIVEVLSIQRDSLFKTTETSSMQEYNRVRNEIKNSIKLGNCIDYPEENEQEIISSIMSNFLDSVDVSVDLDKKYTFGSIVCSINELKCCTPLQVYKVFEYIFINPGDIFTDQNNKITLAVMNELVKLVKEDKLVSGQSYAVFKYVFINPQGIFADQNNKVTLAMMNSLVELVKEDKFFLYENYAIFEHVFINSQGIFADQNNKVTLAMMNSLVKLVESGRFFLSDNYAIFEHVFINPQGIFADQNNPLTTSMIDALIFRVKGNCFYPSQYYQIFHYIFISPVGVFNDLNKPITKLMIEIISNVMERGYLLQEDKNKIFRYYLSDVNSEFKLLENLLLKMFLKNTLRDPEVINKIVIRLFDGSIDIIDTKKGINFFVQLANSANLPLLDFFSRNLDYFINKDGVEHITTLLNSELLIKPLSHNLIGKLVEEKLIRDLEEIKGVMEFDTVSIVIQNLSDGNIFEVIKKAIKERIFSHARSVNDETIMAINDEQIEHLFNVIYLGYRDITFKKFSIKRVIHEHIFGNLDLSNEQLRVIDEFITSICSIDINSIQRNIQDNFLSAIQIENSKREKAHEVISNYLIWDKAIDRFKVSELKKICVQVISNDEKFKSESICKEMYYIYVLNTLPYRSYSNIIDIVNSINDSSNMYKHKLELVISYCQLIGLDPTDEDPLKLFIVTNKQTSENSLLEVPDLYYLNNQNIAGFNLEQIKLNCFKNDNYNKLKQILLDNYNIDDITEIDCTYLGYALFNNLQQLNDNNNLDTEIKNLLSDFVINKKINKANLNKIVNNDSIKLFLKEVETTQLGLNHLTQITFPNCLVNLINNNFTASNIVAKHLNIFIKDIITNNNIKISEVQLGKLEEICYQEALNPGKDISVSLEFKKKLIIDFNDVCFVMDKTEIILEDGEKQQVPAGDFLQIKNYLEINLGGALNEKEKLAKLPELLVLRAEQLKFTEGGNKLIDELYEELNKLSVLVDKSISKYEIAYILGFMFMNISSIHVLGYHHLNDNVAFARFRLLGAYFLSKSLNGNCDWTETQRGFISKQIEMSVLDTQCSGIISNSIYGNYSDPRVKSICTNIESILTVKLVR